MAHQRYFLRKTRYITNSLMYVPVLLAIKDFGEKKIEILAPFVSY